MQEWKTFYGHHNFDSLSLLVGVSGFNCASSFEMEFFSRSISIVVSSINFKVAGCGLGVFG